MKIYAEIEVEPLHMQYVLQVSDSNETIPLERLSKNDLENLLQEYCNNMRDYCGVAKVTRRGIE